MNQLSKVIIAATMIGSFSLLWLMGDLQRKISSLEGQLNPQQPTYSREHPNYVMSINAQKGKKAFVITILVPITQFREPLKIYELPKRLAI